MTDPFGPSKFLYTREFFGKVKKSLRTPYGVFSMHTESPITRPNTFACIQKTLRTVFDHVCPFYIYVQMYSVLWSITMSSEKTDLSTIKAARVDKRLKKHNINDLKVYTGAIHEAAQVAYPYISDIFNRKVRTITDTCPDIPDDIIHQ
jgi:spermidine synthase